MADVEKHDISPPAYHTDNVQHPVDVKGERELPDFVPPTPKEEKAVIRKLDMRLIPLVFLLYMLAVLDRSNLGNARLAGLEVRSHLQPLLRDLRADQSRTPST